MSEVSSEIQRLQAQLEQEQQARKQAERCARVLGTQIYELMKIVGAYRKQTSQNT